MCSGLALIIVLLISISMSVCQELSKKLCEGWTRCKGRTCCQAWTAAKAGPLHRYDLHKYDSDMSDMLQTLDSLQKSDPLQKSDSGHIQSYW